MKNQMTQAEFDAKWPEKKQLLSWWAQQSNSYKLLKAIYARERAHAIAEREKEEPHPTMELPDGKLSCSCGAQVPFTGKNLGVQCQDCSLQWRREWFYEPWSPDKSRVCDRRIMKNETATEDWSLEKWSATKEMPTGFFQLTDKLGEDLVMATGHTLRCRRTAGDRERYWTVIPDGGGFIGAWEPETPFAEVYSDIRYSMMVAKSKGSKTETKPEAVEAFWRNDGPLVKHFWHENYAYRWSDGEVALHNYTIGEVLRRGVVGHKITQTDLSETQALVEAHIAEQARKDRCNFTSEEMAESQKEYDEAEPVPIDPETIKQIAADVAAGKEPEAPAKPEPVSEPCGLVDWDAMAGQIADLVLGKKSQDLGIDIAEIVKSHLSKGGGGDE